MAVRVCLDCHRIGDWTRGRCPEHSRAKDAARGTRAQRGYDAVHDRLRAHWQRRIDNGERVTCWRPDCTNVLTGRDWHLGHHDDRTHAGPECTRCNLHHAGKATHITSRLEPPARGGG